MMNAASMVSWQQTVSSIGPDGHMQEIRFRIYEIRLGLGSEAYRASYAAVVKAENQAIPGFEDRVISKFLLTTSRARLPGGLGTFRAALVAQVVAPIITSFCLVLWLCRYKARLDELKLCLKCGYSMVGLRSNRCPECGCVS
jgi:hypothetical protein